MVRCHGKDKGHLAQRLAADACGGSRVECHAQRQVGLALQQRLQGARQGLALQLELGGRLQGKKRLGQLQQGALFDQAVHGDGELRLPAGGHALDAARYGVQIGQDARALGNQLAAGIGRGGFAGAAVKQQHVQRVFNLPHAVGQGAGHQAQGTRCARQRAMLGHAAQHVQRFGGEEVGRAHKNFSFKIFEACRQIVSIALMMD